MSDAIFVGLDVAKAHLDLAARPGGTHERYQNDEAGIARICGHLQAQAVNDRLICSVVDRVCYPG